MSNITLLNGLRFILTGKWYFYRFTRAQSVCMNECFVIIFRRLFILTKKERKTTNTTNQTKVHHQFLLEIFLQFRQHIRLGAFSFLAREKESLFVRQPLADHILYQSFIEKEKLLLVK